MKLKKIPAHKLKVGMILPVDGHSAVIHVIKSDTHHYPRLVAVGYMHYVAAPSKNEGAHAELGAAMYYSNEPVEIVVEP